METESSPQHDGAPRSVQITIEGDEMTSSSTDTNDRFDENEIISRVEDDNNNDCSEDNFEDEPTNIGSRNDMLQQAPQAVLGSYRTRTHTYLPHSYEPMIKSAIHNAGRWAYGVVAIEVWALDPSTQRLDRIPGGYWRCSSFPASKAVLKLEDETRPDYSPPMPLLPGVGFVGSLWASSSYTDANVSWRDLRIMIADPDQPRIPRTDLLAEAFGLAAGMAFKVGDHRGLVVYYARHTVDKNAISTPSNLRFLRSATDMIGAVSAFRAPREVAVQERAERVQKIVKRLKSKIMVLRMFGGLIRGDEGASLQERESSKGGRRSSLLKQSSRFGVLSSLRRSSWSDSDGNVPSIKRCGKSLKQCSKSLQQCGLSLRTRLARRTLAWRTKVKGGDHLPPPGMPTQESLFSLLVIFLCMLMISGVNEAIRQATGDRHGLLLASFGGLAVNLFCLPASQCSQPRNCFFGLSIAILTTMALVQIFPEDVLPIWVRIAVAPAVSVWAMTWLGYIHPPAGAVAVVFALGVDDQFITLGLLLFGWTLSVTLATILNNMSEKRAYPNYWQWLWVPEPLDRIFAKCRKREGMGDTARSGHAGYFGGK